MMKIDQFTLQVIFSEEDNEYIGLCAEFPGLSWLASTPEDAIKGIRQVVADVIGEMQGNIGRLFGK